ncbi:TPA: hypothetical protein N2D10_003230 [Clostridium botulinum]|nr:hypothetical protein [Clostridium botulinum]
MNVADIIANTIKNQGREIKWVAERIEIPYTSFLYKLKKDSFSAAELVKIGKLLNIDLEELKNKI